MRAVIGAAMLAYEGEEARAQGDYDRARALYEESLALSRTIGHPCMVAGSLCNAGYIAQHLGDPEHGVTQFGEALALAWDQGDTRTAAHCLAGLAGSIGDLDQPEPAARLFGAAAALLETTDATMWPLDRVDYDRSLAAVRVQLGEAGFAAAWEAGRALPPERAIAEATAAATGATDVPSRLAARDASTGLTEREQEVLRLLVEGYSNPEIATALSISRKTASNHVTSILAKLGVETRTAAATLAVRRALV
jgi:DNA-binding CsgD family transcriptional regulator